MKSKLNAGGRWRCLGGKINTFMKIRKTTSRNRTLVGLWREWLQVLDRERCLSAQVKGPELGREGRSNIKKYITYKNR